MHWDAVSHQQRFSVSCLVNSWKSMSKVPQYIDLCDTGLFKPLFTAAPSVLFLHGLLLTYLFHFVFQCLGMFFPSLLINVIVTSLLSGVLCYYYGNWAKQNKMTTLVALLSWWLPAMILTLLPIDVASTYFGDCAQRTHKGSNSFVGTVNGSCRAPMFFAERTVFLALWHTVYWSSQFLTWCLIPIMRSYSTVGDFTALARLRSALLDNVVYYASYSAILIFILIYLLAKKTIVFDLSYLKVLLITAANTWGLFLVVLFLGYGLIEVPRSLWIAGKPIASLHRAYFVLNQKSVELADEEEKLREIIWKVDYLKTRLPVSHPLQPHVLVVYKQAHDSQTISLSYSALEQSFLMTDIDERLRKSIDCGSLNLKQLVRLHKSLKTTQYRWGRAQALYEEAVYAALRMEDMNEFRSKRFPPSATQGSVPGNSASRFAQLFFQIHRYWFCYLRLWSLQLLAVLLTFASIFLIWSECTFSIRSPTLSLVALVLKAEAKAQDFYLLEICSFLILGYLSFAVFFAVFRLRIFNYYRLVGSHHTDENSLLFCGALLCRLTPSLCLNFLGLAHMDSHLSRDDTPSTTPVDPATSASSIGNGVANVETAYTQFMGHLDVIPFIAKGFNIYFPIIILLLCVVSFFRLADRLLHHLGIPQLLDSSEYGSRRGSNPLVDDAILEGRLLLRKERMVLSRRARTSSGRSSSGPKLLGVSRNPFHVSDETSADRTSLLRDADKHGLHSPPRRTLFHEPPIEYSEASINDQFSLLLNP